MLRLHLTIWDWGVILSRVLQAICLSYICLPWPLLLTLESQTVELSGSHHTISESSFISWLCTKQSWAVMIAFVFNNDKQDSPLQLLFWSMSWFVSIFLVICHLCYFFGLIIVMICQHILTYLSFMLLFLFNKCHALSAFYWWIQPKQSCKGAFTYDVRCFGGMQQGSKIRGGR